MKFNDFQAPVLFWSTFKALNLGEKNPSTFKDFQGCVPPRKGRNTKVCIRGEIPDVITPIKFDDQFKSFRFLEV